jgi:hypothetical protein
MVSDRNTLLPEVDVSSKRNLILVGGCVDTPLDLVGTGDADGNRPSTQLLLQWTDNFVGGTWIRVSRRISGQ